MTDLKVYRLATPVSDDRHGNLQRLEVGKAVSGGNGATVKRIEALPEGVRVTFETSSKRYAVTYTPVGPVMSEDEDIQKAPEAAPVAATKGAKKR